MSFINWNVVTPSVPMYYTYIIQPTTTPVTIQVPSQQVPPLKQEEAHNVTHAPQIKIKACKEENIEGTKVKEETDTLSNVKVKEEPNSSDESWDCGKTRNWPDVPIKQENEEEEEEESKIKVKTEDTSNENGKSSRKKSKRDRNYTCEHCTYSTNWKGNLTKHVVSRHTALDDIKWLQCDHCPYKGKTKDYLKCHLQHVHNLSVKWFTCPQCPFKGKLKSHLDRHVIVNHTQNEEIKWFPCDRCTYRAKFKVNLKQHILSKHTDLEDIQWFECEHCSYKAKRKRNLKFHHLNRHTNDDEIEWFKCEFCPYKFKRKASMKVHVASVHAKERKLKVKAKTREIPVFIENRLCWRRVLVDSDTEECSFKCTQCPFDTEDKDLLKKHVLKAHVVTELKEEDDCIVKKSYKTKDVIVLVDDVPYVKKVVEHSLSQNGV